MANKRFRDFGIRPRGSPEIAYDPFVMSQIIAEAGSGSSKERKEKVAKVYNFLLKTALDILPPKQRKVFYSVWTRSGGKLNRGIMDFSRKTKQSHFTNYNNYYKSLASLRKHLDTTGYTDHIIAFLKGEGDLPEPV